MNSVVEVPYDDYGEGVQCFRSSLGYTYLSCRFPANSLFRLELLLTLSGVDPWAWERLAMARLFAQQTPTALATALSRPLLDARALTKAVRAIRRSAIGIQAPRRKPPHMARHLEAFGMPAAVYRQAIIAIYTPLSTMILDETWLAEPQQLVASLQHPNVFQPAFAIMGLTARAIEQMIKSGDSHGDGNGGQV